MLLELNLKTIESQTIPTFWTGLSISQSYQLFKMIYFNLQESSSVTISTLTVNLPVSLHITLSEPLVYGFLARAAVMKHHD